MCPARRGRSRSGFEIDAPRGGFRGRSHWSYRRAAGEYELVADPRTGVRPAPKGATPDDDGFAPVVLTGAPFKLTVTEKGPVAAVPNQS